ncbi:GNAT family N-acetyltransferase [Chryseobacterium sp. CT-SW4]|uniref:GNAT family N-acetyltransferase n=1 Tax=Chryseobacterium sp. SW-1 TaxID=3157343 RepID=UPI003B0156D8
MEFLTITLSDDYLVQSIYHSYSNTFPESERRNYDQFIKLFSHPNVKVIAVLNESQAIGYLILWELSNYIFVEHFEVFEAFRSQKLGSHITGYLFKNYPRIVLEIEPEHLGEDAKRRYSFYQKNGFHLIDEMYVQPSYGEGKKTLDLWLLANYTPENLKETKDEIYDIVYH